MIYLFALKTPLLPTRDGNIFSNSSQVHLVFVETSSSLNADHDQIVYYCKVHSLSSNKAVQGLMENYLHKMTIMRDE